MRQHHLALLCLFLIVGGGTAYALETNSVRSKHIVNGQVRGADVKESSLQGVVLGAGRALADRTLLPNGTTGRPVLDLPGFGRIIGNCPDSNSASFAFKNKTNRGIEVIEVASTTSSALVHTVAGGETRDLSGSGGPRLVTWRFAAGDKMATVWPLFQKPLLGADCHFWMHALVTR